jgi:hypothetical protein
MRSTASQGEVPGQGKQTPAPVVLLGSLASLLPTLRLGSEDEQAFFPIFRFAASSIDKAIAFSSLNQLSFISKLLRWEPGEMR